MSDGKSAFEMPARFFGGEGEAPQPMPAEFTGSAETLLARLSDTLAQQLSPAWELLAKIDFVPAQTFAPLSTTPEIDTGEAMVVTRLGVAAGEAKPQWIDILYPVAALKPYTPSLTAKVIAVLVLSLLMQLLRKRPLI